MNPLIDASMTLDGLAERSVELTQQMADVRKKIAEFLPGGLMALVQRTPGLKSMTWRQYTPYFNDGEPCRFTSEHAYPMINGYDPYEEYGEKEEPTEWDDLDDDEIQERLAPLKDIIKTFMDRFNSDALLAAFGDNVTITVTAERVEIEEYCGHH